MQVYKQELQKLCSSSSQKQAENVYVTIFRGLSLIQYIYTRKVYCQEKHLQPCSQCSKMLSIADSVASQLSTAYRSAFPSHTYKPDLAR